MIDAWLAGLLQQTLALALATIVVRALQATILRRLGAGASYLAWLLVPVAMLVVMLPHPAGGAFTVHVDVSAVTPTWIAPAAVERAANWSVAVALAGATWAVGALLVAALLVQRQRRFEALVAAPTAVAPPQLPAGAGPAVLGVWKRRIVLPEDFDAAFDAEERRLMLLHEGVHLRRGDNVWNLLASVLLALHWFNPCAWWAWRRMRADQESSCDAAVLRHERPATLATYAAALLKVQGVALTPPLATSWQSTHPLVERVRMLQFHRISTARHRAGLRVAALTILVAGFGGYALGAGASAPVQIAAGDAVDAGSVMTAVNIQFDTNADAPRNIASSLLTGNGQKATALYRSDAMGKAMAEPFEIVYTATRLPGDSVQIDTVLRYGQPLATLASPRLITHDGEAARVEVKSADGAHAFAVTFVPKLLAPQAVSPGGAADTRKPAAPDQRAL